MRREWRRRTLTEGEAPGVKVGEGGSSASESEEEAVLSESGLETASGLGPAAREAAREATRQRQGAEEEGRGQRGLRRQTSPSPTRRPARVSRTAVFFPTHAFFTLPTNIRFPPTPRGRRSALLAW